MKQFLDKKEKKLLEKYLPKTSGLRDDMEEARQFLIKNGFGENASNTLISIILKGFEKSATLMGLIREEQVLSETDGLIDAFGESPKMLKKQIIEMLTRRRDEREQFFNVCRDDAESMRYTFEHELKTTYLKKIV